MTGIEIAVGYLFAWAVRKTMEVADAEVDRTLEAAMGKLHDLVSRKLGKEPALQQLAEEAEAGEAAPSGETEQRVRRALEDAAEQDPGFAQALDRAVEQVQAAEDRAAGSTVAAGDSGVAVGGSVSVRADHGAAAAVSMGDVTLGNPPQPGPHRG